MKPKIKGIAALLAIILVFSCALGGSSGIAAPRAEISVPPISTEDPIPSSSQQISPPETTEAPPTTTETQPPPPSSESVTESSSAPTETTVPVTTLTEPYSSTNVTIGTAISGISAKKAFVYDCESKSFLYMKSEADAKLYPASITKLMNVYTALQYLSKDTVLTMTADIVYIVPVDTSKAALYSGDRLTVENVIRATLIPSGSDAAHLLAVSAGRVIAGNASLPAQQAEDVFVEEMNRQAELLGLVNTHFVNCDGYPNYHHYTCMADLVTIATVGLDTPLIRDTVSCAKATLSYVDGRSRTVSSTNYLLKTGSAYYRSDARGMKTGTTDAAGACLLSAFWTGERYMLVGVFQCPSNNARYNNAVKLHDTFINALPPIEEPDPTTQSTAQTTTAAPPVTEESQIPSSSQDSTHSPVPEAPTLTATHAFVYHTASRNYTFLKGEADDRIYPADITKLFTAYVTLQHLALTDEITVGSIAPSPAANTSIHAGDVLTVEQLLMGMLLSNDSDAAHVLAVAAGRIIANDAQLTEAQALTAFVAEMNNQATAAGMVNTHFQNPDGQHDAEHYTCLSDIITLSSLCLDNPVIRSAVSTTQYSVIMPDRTISWTNTNLLLQSASEYYLDTAVGLNAGDAGACLLGAYAVDGEYILTGVFGYSAPDNTAAQYADTLALYNTHITP